MVARVPGQISVIGGNVDDAVTLTHVPVGTDGRLASPDGTIIDTRYPWLCVLQVGTTPMPRRRRTDDRFRSTTLAGAPARPSALPPRQAGRLPSRDRAAMMRGVPRSLEAVEDVVHAREAGDARRFGSRHRTRAAATDEVDLVRRRQARRLQLAEEVAVQRARRKLLPGGEDHPLADRLQIGKTDIGPFGGRPHVDQRRVLVALQRRPRIA